MLMQTIRTKFAGCCVGQRTTGGCGKFVAVVARRLVAVVAVGDKDRLGAHQPGELADHGRVGHRPHAMDDAEMIGGLDRCGAAMRSSSRFWASFVGSGYRPKIWLRFARVARVSSSRSCFGPDIVSSCG